MIIFGLFLFITASVLVGIASYIMLPFSIYISLTLISAGIALFTFCAFYQAFKLYLGNDPNKDETFYTKYIISQFTCSTHPTSEDYLVPLIVFMVPYVNILLSCKELCIWLYNNADKALENKMDNICKYFDEKVLKCPK